MKREDFPFFEKNQGVIYFDNACQSLRPKSVIDAVNEYYVYYSTCAERSLHQLGDVLTKKVEEAREKIAAFINAESKEIIFTKNTTEGINLVAYSFPYKHKAVVTLDKEHNSNFLPWRVKEEKREVRHIIFNTENGDVNIEKLREVLSKEKVDLLSFGLASNIDGIMQPAQEIVDVAHQYGIAVLFDAAQAVPHFKIDVKKLNVDFLAFSGHKMLGPSGTGVLYIKKEWQPRLTTFMVGGGTVSNVSSHGKPFFYDTPERFEAGLQDYAGILGLKAAVEYIKKTGWSAVEQQEKILLQELFKGLSGIKEVNIINGDTKNATRAPLVSFLVDSIDSHEIALMLDKTFKIMVRSGTFCNHYYFNNHNLNAAVRASLAFYNTKEEVEKFMDALKQIIQTLR